MNSSIPVPCRPRFWTAGNGFVIVDKYPLPALPARTFLPLLCYHGMKYLIAALLCLMLHPASAQQGRVQVVIKGFTSDKGVCQACLFNNAENFQAGKNAVSCAAVTIRNRTVSMVFDALPDGAYALLVFHDENSNKKLDKNFLGIPREGYGASLNQLPFAAAPGFDDNKFTVKHSTVFLTIRLRNL